MGEDKKVPKAAPGPAPEAPRQTPGDAAQAEAFDKAQAELAALREKAAKADEYLDMARRAKADFINYQDRVRRDRQEWTRQAVEDFLRDFLPALDSFALARFQDPKLLEAIRLIDKEFLRVLAKNGVTPIETAGKTFDPLYHEALAVLETADKPDGAILDEARRGWTIDGRVIRAASVRIAKRPPPPAP
jgi:molecular chaperone GrpE